MLSSQIYGSVIWQKWMKVTNDFNTLYYKCIIKIIEINISIQ